MGHLSVYVELLIWASVNAGSDELWFKVNPRSPVGFMFEMLQYVYMYLNFTVVIEE